MLLPPPRGRNLAEVRFLKNRNHSGGLRDFKLNFRNQGGGCADLISNAPSLTVLCRSSEPACSREGSVVDPGSTPGRDGVDLGARGLARAAEVMNEVSGAKVSFYQNERVAVPGADRAAGRPALPPGTRGLAYPRLLRSAPSGTDRPSPASWI